MRTLPPTLALAFAVALAACRAGRPEPLQPVVDAPVERDPYRLVPAQPEGSAGLVPAPLDPLPDRVRPPRRASFAFPTGDPATSLVLVERATPEVVGVGQEFRFELVVTSLASVPLDRVTLTERLPESVTVRAAEPEPLAAVPGLLTWRFARLEPGEVRNLEVVATQHAEGPVTHAAHVSCEPVLVATTRTTPPRLRVHLSAPSEVLRCQPIPLRVTVTNTGSAASPAVRLSTGLPAGLVPAGGPVQAFVEVPPLELGSSYTTAVPLVAEAPGAYTWRTGGGGVGALSNAVSVVVREPRLSASLAAPETVRLGEELRLSISVANDGDGVARGTEVELRVPPGAAFASGSGGARALEGSVRWDLGDVHPGEERTLEAALVALGPGPLTARLAVRATCAAEVEAEASAEARAEVRPPAGVDRGGDSD